MNFLIKHGLTGNSYQFFFFFTFSDQAFFLYFICVEVLICFQLTCVHSKNIKNDYLTTELIYKCDFDSNDCSGARKAGDSKIFDIRPSYLTFKPIYYRVTDFSSISNILWYMFQI